jgi:hypothetical protein
MSVVWLVYSRMGQPDAPFAPIPSCASKVLDLRLLRQLKEDVRILQAGFGVRTSRLANGSKSRRL